MSAHPIFSIRNLACSYTGQEQDKVLFVPSLDIPAGEIVYLLGASGSGKSTLLETLGLMNNTIASGSIQFFTGNEKAEYATLWNDGNQQTLSDVRKKYLSFIFQNTNLMENFTAYENVSAAPMIQGDRDEEEVVRHVLPLMKAVNLPLNEVPQDRLASHLSGGQRQRLSFVRALASDFTVLFGDEPTGNLDEQNARELMQVLKQRVSDKNAIIIVSHDIDLALEHASKIICIRKPEEGGFSVISDSDIFESKQWSNLNEEQLRLFRQQLSNYYKIRRPESTGDEQITEGRKNFHYKKLFHTNEYRVLAGVKKRNLIVFTALLALTLLAIGFANGSLQYLEKQMNNSFVNWVTLQIPASRSGDAKDLEAALMKSDVRDQYSIKSVSTYSLNYGVQILNKKEDRGRRVRARDVNAKRDYLLPEIVRDNNKVKGENFRENDLSVIVTTKLLEDFGYDPDADEILMVYDTSHVDMQSPPLHVPLYIRAIVREIPGKFQMLVTNDFSHALNDDQVYDLRNSANGITYYIKADKETASKFADDLKQCIERMQTSDLSASVYDIVEHTQTSNVGYNIDIVFNGYDIDLATNGQLNQSILQSDIMKKWQGVAKRIYDYSADYSFQTPDDPSDDVISINLSNLDNIRNFQNYIANEFNRDGDIGIFELDPGLVKEKENYNFMSYVVLIICWIVIVLGVLSLALYIYNVLGTHLNKIKMNLGTLMAFGLSASNTSNIYMRIVIRFVLLALCMALLASIAIGYSLSFLFSFLFVLESDVQYFQLLHLNTWIALVLILATSLLVAKFTMRKILDRTPGDLIYNR
ncbi:MAG: ABC transporter ATP-binding protein [Flavobacteriales bacterium]